MASKPDGERFYERDDWHDLYSGKNLAEAEDNAIDPLTGERAKLYPLQINPIAKICRVHRSVLFGMPNNYDMPLVQLIVKSNSNQDVDKQKAFSAQEFLRKTLTASTASSLFDEDALKRYGIDPHGKPKVLYMEHWTPDEYVITVDGIVPSLDGYGRLEGQHNWDRVPFVYIPHYRDGDSFGRSQVEDVMTLTAEKNAGSTDRGDLVRGREIDRGVGR